MLKCVSVLGRNNILLNILYYKMKTSNVFLMLRMALLNDCVIVTEAKKIIFQSYSVVLSPSALVVYPFFACFATLKPVVRSYESFEDLVVVLTRDVEAEAVEVVNSTQLLFIMTQNSVGGKQVMFCGSGSAKSMPLPLPHPSKKHTANNLIIFYSIY